MIVIHITSDYPPQPLWGMGKYVHTLHTGLTDRSPSVTSVVATGSKSLTLDDERLITTTPDEDTALLSQAPDEIFNDFQSFVTWQQVLSDKIIDYLAKVDGQDVILHANNWMSWITAREVSKKLGVPIVVSVHFLQKMYDAMSENPIPTFHDEIIAIEQEMIANADALICFSPESERMIRHAYNSNPNYCVVIPHTSQFKSPQTSTEPTYNIIHLGRVVKDKGIFEAVSTAEILYSKYPQVRLHIVGDGAELSNIQKKQLPFIICHGYVDDQKELQAIISKCSFSLLLSTADVFPISVIDSMACGAIPILQDNNAVAVMFENGVSGYRADPETLIEKTTSLIDALYQNPARLTHMRRATTDWYYQNYSLEVMLERHTAVYEKLLS